MFDPRDPDASLVALFKHHAQPNEARSMAEGRPICDDVEVVEIRYPGSRNFGVYPANMMSHWAIDPFTGTQTPVTYAQRFRRQYEQFKAHLQQTKSGTPLQYAPFLTEGRRRELQAQNIYTVEALAEVEGAELKNLGHGGREMKNQAIEYLAMSKERAPNTQMQAELEALRARNMALEQDNEALAKKAMSPEARLDDMSVEELREYITANTGIEPQGNIGRKTLARMALDCRPEKVA